MESAAEWGAGRDDSGVSESTLQTFERPPRRLYDQRRARVVPVEELARFLCPEPGFPAGDEPIGMGFFCSPLPAPRSHKLSKRMVDVSGAPLADGLSRKFDGSRDGRMRRHARQPTQLIGAETQDVVQARIGAVQLQGAVEFALAAEHAR